MVIPLTTPTSNADIPTPQKRPGPPMTTTTKATVMISAPIAGCTFVIGAWNAPPRAAMPSIRFFRQIRAAIGVHEEGAVASAGGLGGLEQLRLRFHSRVAAR